MPWGGCTCIFAIPRETKSRIGKGMNWGFWVCLLAWCLRSFASMCIWKKNDMSFFSLFVLVIMKSCHSILLFISVSYFLFSFFFFSSLVVVLPHPILASLPFFLHPPSFQNFTLTMTLTKFLLETRRPPTTRNSFATQMSCSGVTEHPVRCLH